MSINFIDYFIDLILTILIVIFITNFNFLIVTLQIAFKILIIPIKKFIQFNY